MSFLDDLQKEPYRFDFYDTLRRIERGHPEKPRIGDSQKRDDEFLLLGQDPYLVFPASTLSAARTDEQGRLHLHARFLGMLGPQGALPTATTEEALRWFDMRDDSFARFLDVFHHRFLQLFFRAWGDARPVVQHDRPDLDRFADFIGSTIGIGSRPHHSNDSINDLSKLSFAGLLGAQAKSASRLRRLISGLFDVECEIDQFIGAWLMFERPDQIRLGRKLNRLGTDCIVGAGVFSVQDKIRVRLFTSDLKQYQQFLPTGEHCEALADAVFFFLGDQMDYDVELAIPAGRTKGAKTGSFGQLGWTTWIAPNWVRSDMSSRTDARFHPSSRMAMKRRKQAQAKAAQAGKRGGKLDLRSFLEKPARFAPRPAARDHAEPEPAEAEEPVAKTVDPETVWEPEDASEVAAPEPVRNVEWEQAVASKAAELEADPFADVAEDAPTPEAVDDGWVERAAEAAEAAEAAAEERKAGAETESVEAVFEVDKTADLWEQEPAVEPAEPADVQAAKAEDRKPAGGDEPAVTAPGDTGPPPVAEEPAEPVAGASQPEPETEEPAVQPEIDEPAPVTATAEATATPADRLPQPETHQIPEEPEEPEPVPSPEWRHASATVVAALREDPFADAPEVPPEDVKPDQRPDQRLDQRQDEDMWDAPLAVAPEDSSSDDEWIAEPDTDEIAERRTSSPNASHKNNPDRLSPPGAGEPADTTEDDTSS